MLNYKNLRAVREHLRVTDQQLDQKIEQLLQQHHKIVPVSGRPTQLDDEVLLDFEGFCDGQSFEGGKAERHPLVLGSGTFIPGFEEQLLNHRAGEEVDVEVTFPVAYPVATLAGKKATFHCKIQEIRVHEPYRADDEFAREVGKCESMESFRAQLRDNLQAFIDRQADLDLKEQLIDQLCAQYPCEITDEQREKALDIEMQELEAQLAQQHLTLDLYCQFMGKTRAQLREDRLRSAERNVRRQSIIAEIAQQEHIEADEESLAEAFAALCRDHHMTMEELQPYFDRTMEAVLTRAVIEEKVLNLIRDSAQITDVEKKA